uniref:4-hydroxyphenylpyruvate dioxygenase n=1 Tax=Romanomermis culicivorax TaxID=13658 RepID=A0A915HQB8_ROMCU
FQEFLNYYAGPGIQHVALYTNDIVGSVRALKNREVEFYTVENVYYVKLRCKLTNVNFEIVEDLQEGFGAGNFKALFEAVENGQRARGNLLPKNGYL